MTKRKRMKRYYRVTELAQMAGISRQAMSRLLQRKGVEFEWVGPKLRLVPLSELEEKLSSLFRSDRIAKVYEELRRVEDD